LAFAEARGIDTEVVVPQIPELQAVPVAHVRAASLVDPLDLALGGLRIGVHRLNDVLDAPRPRRVQKQPQHARLRTKDGAGASTDDEHVIVRGIFAYRRLDRPQNLLVERLGRRRLRELGRRALQTREEALPERAPGVLAGLHLLFRNAQTLGNDNRQLLVDVLVAKLIGRASGDRQRAGAVLVRDGNDHSDAEHSVPMAPLIQTRDLCKTFRSVKRVAGPLGALRTLFSRDYEERVAVAGVTLSLEPGELVGYIGPNGAGKSTTIKMLTGILVPTSGEVRVAGLVPWQQRKENARNIGVVFGQRSQLYWDLPLVESFELLRAIYGIPRERYRRNLEEFVEMLAMQDTLKVPVRQLSLGQRMRGDFAAAMLHDPKIIYLDEPTIGLDVVAKEAIRAFIARINAERGTTVILTTHDLADVERLCRRIILIDRGKLIYDGGIERLRDEYGRSRTLVVRFSSPVAAPTLDGAELAGVTDSTARFRFDRTRERADLLVRQASERYSVEDVSIEEPDLESIIRRIYVEGYAS
jgi:ABC-2 type transport system ATP-binding protein